MRKKLMCFDLSGHVIVQNWLFPLIGILRVQISGLFRMNRPENPFYFNIFDIRLKTPKVFIHAGYIIVIK